MLDPVMAEVRSPVSTRDALNARILMLVNGVNPNLPLANGSIAYCPEV